MLGCTPTASLRQRPQEKRRAYSRPTYPLLYLLDTIQRVRGEHDTPCQGRRHTYHMPGYQGSVDQYRVPGTPHNPALSPPPPRLPYHVSQYPTQCTLPGGPVVSTMYLRVPVHQYRPTPDRMKIKPIVSERCRSWWWGTNFKENATFPMGTITVDAKNKTFALHGSSQSSRIQSNRIQPNPVECS